MEIVSLAPIDGRLQHVDLPDVDFEDKGFYPFPNDKGYAKMQEHFNKHVSKHAPSNESTALVVGTGFLPYISEHRFPQHIVVADNNLNSLAWVSALLNIFKSSEKLPDFTEQIAENDIIWRSLTKHIRKSGNPNNTWSSSVNYGRTRRNILRTDFDLVFADLSETEQVAKLARNLAHQDREISFANLSNAFFHVATRNGNREAPAGMQYVEDHIDAIRLLRFSSHPFILATAGTTLKPLGPFHSVDDYDQRIMRETRSLFAPQVED
jgi:hypothetical protein